MSPDLVDHPVLDSLFRYWNGKRGGRAMPARSDIDPVEMGPRLLPHLALGDLADRGTRVRFRLVGTSVVKRLGFDPTGQYLDELMSGSYFALLAALHGVAYAERAPVHSESLFRWNAGRELQAHHLLLPLSNGGTEPAIALMGVVFRSDEAFPPQLRALNDIAIHAERRRRVLPLSTSSAWDGGAGLNVA